VKGWQSSQIVGSPDSVMRQIDELVERTGADELMLTTMTHAPAARLRSYQLVAEATGLGTAGTPAATPTSRAS
jgi:alkanesulfonate monooxygenase SsuD/methylene tetrahydromethanopterin reductase-like flavin-dependent oxidoreductase (luciferase family)